MITFMESKEKLEEMETCLDSQLWHACAGGMIQMPSINSKVFYFPQGHAEHARGIVDFKNCPRIPAYILCRVAGVKFMADPETDEVFGKIKLTPIATNELDLEDDGIRTIHVDDTHDKPASFAKTLTQSDANNGGGFSVPRYCAETIFPRLDYAADPPVQTVLVKDVHGETWKFRHIYRGTPRRHLLTTGWSSFVNRKKLVAGDSIVFLRAKNGDLCVGIRRAKKGIGGGHVSSSVWNAAAGNCMEDESKLMRYGSSNGLNLTGKAKVRPEQVIEAASLAANGQQFEVVYYPRASTPEFCVKASLVKATLRIRWCTGMRFKMAFETEDSSRISWFMGCISSIQVVDALRWPDSPWRLLQVMWDEPDLLQNVKCVSPWLVELVSNMPSVHLSPFSPPRKKPRLLHHPDFTSDGQFPMPTFSGNPFRCLLNTSPAGMQGARHAHYGLFSDCFPSFDHRATPNRISNGGLIVQKPNVSDNVSCVLTIAHSTENSTETSDARKPQLVLFGQPILTEQQLSRGCSGSARNLDRTASFSDSSGSELHQQGLPLHASCQSLPWYKDNLHKAEPDLEMKCIEN